MLHFSLLKPLIEPATILGKVELIKRIRRFYNNQALFQIVSMIPFSLIGRNEKGELYFC